MLASVGESFDAIEAWWALEQQFRPRAHPATVAASRMRAMADRLAAESRIDDVATMATLGRELRRRFVHAMTALSLDVRDARGYTHAEVTAGGVSMTTSIRRRCSRAVAQACSSWAKCSTLTGVSAASTSSGRGRAPCRRHEG
jgi:hypothetical protein